MTGIVVVTRAAAQIPAEQPTADAFMISEAANGTLAGCSADQTGLDDSTAAISEALAAAQPDACTKLNRAGQPCKGRPVRDGRCPAHKAR